MPRLRHDMPTITHPLEASWTFQRVLLRLRATLVRAETAAAAPVLTRPRPCHARRRVSEESSFTRGPTTRKRRRVGSRRSTRRPATTASPGDAVAERRRRSQSHGGKSTVASLVISTPTHADTFRSESESTSKTKRFGDPQSQEQRQTLKSLFFPFILLASFASFVLSSTLTLSLSLSRILGGYVSIAEQ